MKIHLDHTHSEHIRKFADTTYKALEEQMENLIHEIGQSKETLASIEANIDEKKNTKAGFKIEELLLKNTKSYMEKTSNLKELLQQMQTMKREMKQDFEGDIVKKLNEKYEAITNKVEITKKGVVKYQTRHEEMIKTLEKYKLSIETNKIENSAETYSVSYTKYGTVVYI